MTDSPSTTITAGSHAPSHTQLFDGKLSLPRRFSYTSVNNRFGAETQFAAKNYSNECCISRLQVTSHAMREVPYARLIDSSPTTGYPPTKLDSDSRLNTLSGALNVPNGTNDGTPKSSISDSKLAVDYFNSNPTSLSNAKDNEVSNNECLIESFCESIT